MYFILSLAKKSVAFDYATRNDNFWIKREMGAQDIAEKSVLLVGFGRIGSRVAKRALAFDMKVSVFDPFVDDAVIKAAGCAPVQTLDAVLPQMDFVSLHCPKSPQTVNMIGGTVGAMKPAAYLINTARGGMVDEGALYDAWRQVLLPGQGLMFLPLNRPRLRTPCSSSTTSSSARTVLALPRNQSSGWQARQQRTFSTCSTANRILTPSSTKKCSRKDPAMKTRLKDCLKDGRTAINGWLSIPNSFTAEIFAAQDFDSITIDMQHGLIDYQSAVNMLQAMTTSDATPMVRPGWNPALS